MRLMNPRFFAFFCVLVIAAAAAAQDRLSPEVQFQRDLVKEGLMHLPGIEAVAFNLDQDDPYVVLYVNESALRGVGPRTFSLETLRGIFAAFVNKYGIKVVRLERAVEFHALQAKMGTSTSNDAGCGIGTLGIVAIDANNVRGYLTAAHVAAARGRLLCVNGTEKDQLAPARGDSHHCTTTTQIGELVAAPRIPVRGVKPGTVDAAFVKEIPGQIDPVNACGLCPSDLSIPDPKTIKGMEVRTCGRPGTATTSGTVIEPQALAWVTYPCGVRALFESQILVEKTTTPLFAQPGYSGAVAYGTKSGNVHGVVGLIFASDLSVGRTLLNPMQTVLNELTKENKGVAVRIDAARHCR